MIKYISAILMFIAGLFVVINVVNVNVCHATGSNTNPYNLITVAVHSVDDANGLNGHGTHEGDAWMSFEFEGVIYPGQNEDLFIGVIDSECNLIVEPTATNTLPPPTDTSTPTNTLPPPTNTSTPTSTPVDPTSTLPPPPTPTTPVETPPVVITSTPTLPPNPPPTSTSTVPPNPPPTFTSTVPPNPPPTNTPFPPKADIAKGLVAYSGDSLGKMVLGKMSFDLFKGVKAEDGSLMLPTFNKGAALYNNVIWVHREWRSGSVNMNTGSVVSILEEKYIVTEVTYLPYGVYPEDNGLYIATCYRDNLGDWAGVALYKLVKEKYMEEK